MNTRLVFALLFALGSFAATTPTAQSPGGDVCALTTTDRVVAIGDVHGGFDQFTAILKEAGIVDKNRKWAGDKTTFVQTGDIVDRGPDSRKALDLMRQLEKDAPKTGGRVISLLGNHEVMRIIGDTRYVSAGEYAAFRDAGSEDLRKNYYESISKDRATKARAAGEKFDEAAFRKSWYESAPLGSIELALAFGPKGDYGKWLRTHDTMAIINGVAYMHGGTSPDTAKLGCAAINQRVRGEFDKVELGTPEAATSLMLSPDGPLWYRGLVPGASEAPATPEQLDGIMQALGVKTFVVGHSAAADGKIKSHFGGRIYQIDTGMLDGTFFPNGRPTALEVSGGTFTEISIGARSPIGR